MPDFLLDSTHFEVLRVAGADAERFLQGQVTCDVAAVTEQSFAYGAACNNKGRVIAPFMICRQQQDFLLVFHAGLAALFMAALKKFLPFYKCNMALDAELACIGAAGAQLPQWLATRFGSCPAPGAAEPLGRGLIARMTGEHPQFIVCADSATLQTLSLAAADLTRRDDGTRWQGASLCNGHFPFAVADSELYTPQELHYEQQQYISFTKGCYTGQEIVARMHYRGKIKKQFYLVTLATPAGAAPTPLALLDAAGGLLAECTKTTHLSEGGTLALALLPVDAALSLGEVPTSIGINASLRPF